MAALPVVSVAEEPGKKFFLDERLRELRNVKTPFDRISLNEFELEFYKKAALKSEINKLIASACRVERVDENTRIIECRLGEKTVKVKLNVEVLE